MASISWAERPVRSKNATRAGCISNHGNLSRSHGGGGRPLNPRALEGASGELGWQLVDPSTGSLLYEGGGSVVTLPDEDGPYRVRVAPLGDRGRFISIDAVVGAGGVEIG